MVWACTLIGCSPSSGGSAATQGNPCATKGASYQLMFSETSGGTCGPFNSSFLINVGSDGTIQNRAYLSCPSYEVSGCTTHASNCTGTMSNTTCTIALDFTFSSDGSSLTGQDTASCFTQGQTCSSGYSVSAKRQ
jgi:hypothetical protein